MAEATGLCEPSSPTSAVLHSRIPQPGEERGALLPTYIVCESNPQVKLASPQRQQNDLQKP